MQSLKDAVTAYFEGTQTRPNRALGQNFCVDAAALDAVVSALPVHGAAVVEIGAGLGALTERLLLTDARRVYAVELDAALAARTGARLLCDRLTVVLGDVMELDPGIFPTDALWCGNLPYYITTPIAQLLLSLSPAAMALMVQQEAADRFFAAPGAKNYGPVAVVTQLYYEAEILRTLGPESYYPQPDVRSCIVGFRKKSAAPDVPAETRARVEALAADIVAGTIEVSVDYDGPEFQP